MDSSGDGTDRPCGDEQHYIVLVNHVDGIQFTGSTTNLVIEQSENLRRESASRPTTNLVIEQSASLLNPSLRMLMNRFLW